MPERPDLRQIAGDIREALEGYERETLVEILTYVFKEYVVEGPPPLRADEVQTLEELEGLNFPELIAALQTRLDLPELSLFQVRGDQVHVRAGGTLTPLSAGDLPDRAGFAAPPAPAPAPGPAESSAAATEDSGAPADRPTVDEAVSRGRGDLAGQERGVVQAPPPRPGGLTISGRPSTSSSPSPNTNPSPTPSPNAEPSPDPGASPQSSKPPAPTDEKTEEAGDADGDDASIRFSLLELD